jgi:hypothetical protein
LGALAVHVVQLEVLDGYGWEGLGELVEVVWVMAWGRILLALLPPGDAGGHAPRELPLTLSVSTLLFAVFAPVVSSPRISCVAPFPFGVELGAFGLLLAAGFARWFTRPGAMVPRHAVASEPTPLLDRSALALGCVWLGWLLADLGASVAASIALFVCVFFALGTARRSPFGRHAALFLGATCTGQDHYGFHFGLFPALGLGLGACALVPWLRRGDRRAGALAGIGFGSLFLAELDPLAYAAAAVFVLVSPARLRRFALLWVAVPGALAALRATVARVLPEGGRRDFAAHELGWDRRALHLDALAEYAFDADSWGLAWPIVLAALALGALTFPWRAQPFEPNTIEEPQREVRALAVLIAAAVLALALPWSPWLEQEVPQILFAPLLLLAGLLVIPPERVPA